MFKAKYNKEACSALIALIYEQLKASLQGFSVLEKVLMH